ncbi:MAG: hypothetical protein COY80_00140 [Candidatus Pacebacteria bacterium CG_4_10_14_0_8_um_filter_42_14]|nr:MAG: hypothetical protein COY80_00140 [Candidatus Pacebacteria bacterium CG_4_10_14_0_8_um_filter_42_14]
MLFSEFAFFLSCLEALSSRLAMTEVLAELYTKLSQEELKEASYLLQGSLVPPYQSLEFQISNKLVIRSLAQLQAKQESTATNLFGESDATGSELQVSELFIKTGDIGTVAEKVSEKVKIDKKLTLLEVFSRLRLIAEASGDGSQAQKVNQLVALFSDLEPISNRYIARIVIGKMRLGFSTMTLLDALSWAKNKSKEESKVLENAYQKKADVGALAQVYLVAKTKEERDRALANYSVSFAVPVIPQLCQRLHSAEEIIEKLGEVFAEPKYDGLRIQLHISTDTNEVHAYTRSLEDATHMFPELAVLPKAISAHTVILDAEAIGYDPDTGVLLPFQDTITRKRKHDVASKADSVPIRFYVYDVMLIDGESLIDKPLEERKKRLLSLFSNSKTLTHSPVLRTKNAAELQRFHEEQLRLGLEGAVVKQVMSPYQSGRKGWYWVKIKEAAGTRGKLADTLDCLVLGYYPGRGKRTQFGVGAFLVGVLDGDKVRTIAKIGTGLTDDQFRELKKRCDELKTSVKPEAYDVPKDLFPGVWCLPGLVTEIAADELTRSPMHTAGLALRFPRLVRFRDDKKWRDATSVSELGDF